MRIYPLHQRSASTNADAPALAGEDANSLAQYRIRLDDGSEAVIPSSEALTAKILAGEILPDTVIFDAGRAIWCRAAESALVRFIVELSIERPELHGWVDEEDTPIDVPVGNELAKGEFLAALEVAMPSAVPNAPQPAPVSAKAPESVPATVKAPEPAPVAAKAPERTPVVAKAPEPAPAVAKAPEPAPIAKTAQPAPAATKPPERAPVVAKAPEPPAAAKAPQPAPNPKAVEHAPIVAKVTEPAPNAKAPEPKPVIAKAPEPTPVVVKPTEPKPVVVKPAAPTKAATKAPETTPAKPGRPDADAVAAALDRIAPLSSQPVPQDPPRRRPIAHTEFEFVKPEPFTPLPPEETPEEVPLPEWASAIPDWELGPEVETGDASLELVTAGASAGPRVQRGSKQRTRFVAGSLLGGVAAMVTLGVVLQGREASADDLAPPVMSMAPSAGPVTVGETSTTEISSITTLAGETDVVPEVVAAPAPAAPAEPATPLPKLAIPELTGLNAGAIGSNLDVRPTGSGGLVALPTPPRPTGTGDESSRPIQLPQLRNARQVQQALDREYPIGLKEVGQGGRVEMSFYINDRGEVEEFEIKQSSGIAALDQAALRVAPVFQFTPAQRGNQRLAVWYSSGITFGRVTSATMAGTASSATPPAAEAPNQPTPTQFDVAPQVRNAGQVRQELDRQYPIGLRATGKGGRVEVWFYVNERGRVEQARLKRTSGDADLDQAALRVARVFEFIPGLDGNQPSAGWISLAIVFDALSGEP
jgi:TonB family protein